jgi:hypothetical protein
MSIDVNGWPLKNPAINIRRIVIVRPPLTPYIAIAARVNEFAIPGLSQGRNGGAGMASSRMFTVTANVSSAAR